MKKIMLTTVALGAVFAVNAANTWYVDDDNYGKSGLDGKSRATAWGTLQDAHNNASAGDTIWVLPGTYDQGVTDAVGKSRLAVSKKLFFRADSGSATNTIVLGAKDPSTLSDANFPGVGAAAIRCLRISSGAEGSEFHNITFRGGATTNTSSIGSFDATKSWNGGCVSCAVNAYLVDCVIEDGAAGGVGGGVASSSKGCKLIRCLVDGCYGQSWGSVVVGCKLWFSVLSNSHNKNNGSDYRPAIGSSILVNCSVYGTNCSGGQYDSTAYNSVFGQCDGPAIGNSGGISGKFWFYNSYCNTNLVAGTTFYRAFLAPAVRDYRLVPGTAAVNGGKTAYYTDSSIFALPEGVEMKDFDGNVLDTTSETCHAGAVQQVTAPVGGRFEISSEWPVNGCTNLYGSYVYADHWPNSFRVANKASNFLRYRRQGGSRSYLGSFVYPDSTGTAIIATPPPSRSDDVLTFSSDYCNVCYWCDPDADPETADGSEEHPFPTLQDAIDCAASNKIQIIKVMAMPGDYCTGGGTIQGHNCRLAIPTNVVPIIVSTGGKDVTFITGAADPDSPNADYPGCGPKAVRCVGCATDGSHRLLLGFTLRNGYSNCADPSTLPASDCAGAMYGGNAQKFQLTDCIITNCHAVTRACGYLANFTRCRFVDCKSGGLLFADVSLVASVVEPSCESSSATFGGLWYVYFSTVPDASFHASGSSGSRVYGSLLKPGALSGIPGSAIGSFEDGYYANKEIGDWRVMSAIPAVDAYGKLSATQVQSVQDVFCSNVQLDLDGRDYFEVGETHLPFPGAIQQKVDGVYVGRDTSGGYTVSGGTTGRGYTADDLPITIEAKDLASAARPLAGIAVGGVTNEISDTSPITITAEQLTAAGGALAAMPVYTTDWYVDDDGSDSNTGFTAESAKKNLATVLGDSRLAYGDTVHAAAGRYDDLVNVVNDRRYRAAVPSGVKLIGATDGETVIVGAKDTTSTGDADGFGAAAVRGVRLANYASVKNLVIINCWTEQKEGNGAGLHAATVTLEAHPNYLAENCLITNCWASNTGGGAAGVRLVKCRLFHNRCKDSGGSTRDCELFGCITDYSYQGAADTSSANSLYWTAVNSTLGSNNKFFDGTGRNAAIGNFAGTGNNAPIKNCIALGEIRVSGPIVNCIYADAVMYTEKLVNSKKATVAEIALDAEYRPTVGTSVAIDFGSNTLYTANAAILGDTDILGTQRIYNGIIDAGAVEGDWRARYARVISHGSSRFAVDSASSNVVEKVDEGVRTVLVGTNATLVATWSDAQNVDCKVTVKVSGTGAKIVAADGEHLLAASDVAQTLTLRGEPPSSRIVFDNTGNDGDLEIISSRRLGGAMLLIR